MFFYTASISITNITHLYLPPQERKVSMSFPSGFLPNETPHLRRNLGFLTFFCQGLALTIFVSSCLSVPRVGYKRYSRHAWWEVLF